MGVLQEGGNGSASKVLKLVLMVYVTLSLLYATSYFAGFFRESDEDIPGLRDTAGPDPVSAQWGNDSMSWGRMHSVPEKFFLSKAFGESLQPSQVIPYYFRAEQQSDEEDITMATLITPNRFKVFDRLVTRYQGPISVAIHVGDNPEKRNRLVHALHVMYHSNPLMKKYVDVHLIVDAFERQFNMWRNVAKLFARTKYIMMLDVDFYLCTNFWDKIRSSERIMNMLRQGNTAIVIAAFEYLNQADGIDYRTFPKNKHELLREVETKRLDMFHAFWWRGHGSTNYTEYYVANDIFKVTKYQYHYEPYVIFPRDSAWCDERFVGYGANKAACLFELYLSGVDFWVMPDDFIIHQTHKYLENTRRMERKYNKKLYDHFREEVCFRYAQNYINAGIWDSPKTANLREECHKIRGFNQAVEYFNSQ